MIVFTRQDLCFGTCRQIIVYCLNLAFGPRRKMISPVIFDLDQTVKCSLLDEKIVYQSFFGAPLTFSYFLLQGKVLCFARVGKSLARCLFLNCSKDLVAKIISPVKFDTNHSNSKMLFLKQLIVYQSFYSSLLAFSYFLLEGKVLCFARVGMSLSRCLFLKRSEYLVDKIISPVLLDTNRLFKW